jgi:signal transduction histidine kinase
MNLLFLKTSGYRTKLLLAILAVSLPLFVWSEIDQWMVMQRFAYNLLIDRVNAASNFLINQVENKLKGDAPSVVPEIGNYPNIKWVMILDNEGVVQYSTAREWMGKRNPVQDLEDFQEFKKGLVIRSVDLRIFERTWKLQFGYSTKKVIDDLDSSLYRDLVIDGIICFIVLLFAWIVTGFLQKPLVELKKNTLKMARGDFSVAMNVKSKDIIGELSAAFNIMAHDVHDLTENLEEKIKSATKQLTSKNQELETSNARLKELDKFRSDFLAMLSHDIKGPLASILGFAQTLETIDVQDEKRLKYLRIIQAESKQLTALVSGMLDISRMESKTFPLEFGPVNLPEMLTEALNGFQEQSAMVIEKHVPAGLPPVWGDKNMLLRVVGNILDNAKKYCDNQGEIELSATEADGGIRVLIKDSGPGIPEEDREKVFDKFYRSRFALAHKKKGSGLGLAIVKAIIDAHGGSVWCESGPGKGATIGFCLPASGFMDGRSVAGKMASETKTTVAQRI